MIRQQQPWMDRNLVPRLAWFTPLPPVRSGIAQYNVELLPSLASHYQIDLFVDGHPGERVHPDGTLVYNAHDFVWKHFRQPYHLVVYQLGNASCHDYMWAYLARYPGLVVLHDGQLHHARALSLLGQKRHDDYRSEFGFNHPDADIRVAELGIWGLLGSLTYLWPMRRVVTQSARMVAVHNQWLADEIGEDDPQASVVVVEMGVPAPESRPCASEAIRARHGIPADAVLFVAFGDVTPEKRIPQALQGLASILGAVPNVHLLLAGKPVAHYDLTVEARALGVMDRVTTAGFVPQEEVADYLAAADVCVCLRWPSSRETSAAWLRCLAAGRPTIVTDLVHTVDVPAYDPRTWTPLHAPTAIPDAREWPVPAEPACVSVDILDEDHSLRLAMHRLANDPRLRTRLGRRARALWAERFTLDRMVTRYREMIDAACAAPMPDAARRGRLPEHFRTSGTEHASRLLRQMGVPDARIGEIWTPGQAPP